MIFYKYYSKFKVNNNEVQNGLQLHNNYSCVDVPLIPYNETTVLTTPLCSTITPLGLPVVPEV